MKANRTLAAGFALLLTMGASAEGCEEDPRLAKCEKAIRKEYRRAQEDQDDGRRPAKCRGVSKRELRRILVRVIREETPALDPPSRKDE